jgi:hypothetical protein
MPRIRCNYDDCVFLDDGICGAGSVELDPLEGCLTYSQANGVELPENLESELGEVWEEEGYDGDDDDGDDDFWLED